MTSKGEKPNNGSDQELPLLCPKKDTECIRRDLERQRRCFSDGFDLTKDCNSKEYKKLGKKLLKYNLG